MRISTVPPAMLKIGEIVHSSASLSFVSLPRRIAVIGTRKFSVNSSERPTTMKMKAIPKASEPKKWAASSPKCGVIARGGGGERDDAEDDVEAGDERGRRQLQARARQAPLALVARAREHLVRLGRLLGLVGLWLGRLLGLLGLFFGLVGHGSACFPAGAARKRRRRQSTSWRSSGVTAGPASTAPSTSKREPWHGQSQLRSASLKCSRQPRCVQRSETPCATPSSSR